MFNAEEIRELTIVERFRESHHAVAMMFASGMTPQMIRRRTGYSMRRLTLLEGDVAFQELVAQKHKIIAKQWEENYHDFADLGMKNMIQGERQISDQLDEVDNGERVPISLTVLNKISMDRADRFGYGKNSTVNVKHDFGALLDRAQARSNAVRVIEASPLPLLAEGEGRGRPSLTERSLEPADSLSVADVQQAPIIYRRRVA